MTMPYEHLVYAQAQLAHARNQLADALTLTKDQGYNRNWVAAIEKAQANNDETERQVTNILVNIRSPQYEQYEQLIEGLQKED